jgi:hypothetical protein
MPIPIGLRNRVEFEAKRGIGWEDVCTKLQVPIGLRDDVRRIVLRLDHDHQRESKNKAKAVRPLLGQGDAKPATA